MEIKLKPLAWVRNSRIKPQDDHWGDIVSEIVLDDEMPDSVFLEISSFSHLEIIYYFDKVPEGNMSFSRKPRGNPAYPQVGIFAQRNKDRPNRIGLCTVELMWHRGRTLGVKMLDAIDGTPILDIKPVFREFREKKEIRQPEWVTDLLKDYY
jgi:tRNA (adenine37-N6)-methyltransferase